MNEKVSDKLKLINFICTICILIHHSNTNAYFELTVAENLVGGDNKLGGNSCNEYFFL